jgi:hypothetical protein
VIQLIDRFFLWKKGPRPVSPEEQRIRVSLETLRRLLQEAVNAGFDRDVADALRWLADNGPAIEKGVVAWVDLLELLVQDTEERFGTQPGRGEFKADQVKAVVRYLLRAERFSLPRVPDYLQPLVLDVVVDWSIDAVVEIVNEHDLWLPSREAPATLLQWLALQFRRLLRLLRPLWEVLARVASWIYWGLHRNLPLSPALRAALRRIEKEGMLVDPQQLLREVSRSLIWLGTHRRSVVAGVALISAAVQEAERFLELSGPRKKEYAQAFVWAVLDELGFDVKSGVVYALVNALIGSGIESAVHLFNRRGMFEHRRQQDGRVALA